LYVCADAFCPQVRLPGWIGYPQLRFVLSLHI